MMMTMNKCIECNREVYEETNMCEDCTEKRIRENEVKMDLLMSEIVMLKNRIERNRQEAKQLTGEHPTDIMTALFLWQDTAEAEQALHLRGAR